MTKEDAIILRDYLEAALSSPDNYEFKFTRDEINFLISAIDEAIAY